ncbi:hypothetical protein DICPUDRAFT_158805 [Dictyostelium purpureum]|uniref:Uncharacterized protein n=1 Tax=Dictyostelium purpureum TaxID=5786 RepID=F1A2J2_DICPU|nr:uncharacterized protein DICPUDRAFT_158805 [Dictyostelium purpureum]EGC29586.1 hypothetical protein DICPUDRAFT_158805 [Dictyostelium purpureum]|eukprot:XP_003293888.1 hypothetical protein DICPUDRAFT_158805 [Dictyostelium purpureum]
MNKENLNFTPSTNITINNNNNYNIVSVSKENNLIGENSNFSNTTTTLLTDQNTINNNNNNNTNNNTNSNFGSLQIMEILDNQDLNSNTEEYYLFLLELSSIVRSSSFTSGYILRSCSNSTRISNYLKILIGNYNKKKIINK